MNLRNSRLDTHQAEDRLPQIEITVSRNALRFHPRRSMVLSGLRMGPPAFASAGFGTSDFRPVADIIAGVPLPSFDDDGAVNLRERISALADTFPLYRGLLS